MLNCNSLLNMHHCVKLLLFLVMRIFKTYSQQILSSQYHIFNCSHHIVHYIPVTDFMTERFYLLISLDLFAHISPLAATHLFSVYMGFVVVVFLISHISEIL